MEKKKQMVFVVDTSVLIAVIANEPIKARLIERTRSAELVAPHSIHWEIGNAFSAMIKRQRLRLADATKALELYAAIPVRFVDVDLAEALQLSAELDIYAYDAYVISCALGQRAPMLTLDRRLLKAARTAGVDALEIGL
jgi:predicted nucleic acid-binding protein